MAEQMLKQAALSGMKSKDDLLDLKRINNQPLEKNSSNLSSLHMDDYLPFTPLGRKKTFATSTPVTHFAGDGTDTSQIHNFQIRNMEESDSEEDTVEDESQVSSDHSSSAPVHEHGYTKSLPDDTDSSSAKEADSKTKKTGDPKSTRELEANTKDGLQIRHPANSDDKYSDSDTYSAPCEIATGESKSGERKSGHPEVSTVNGGEEDGGLEFSQSSKMTDDNESDIAVQRKMHSDRKVTETEVSGTKSQTSHEMECQTEEVSGAESSGEEDGEEKPEKKQKLDKDEEDLGGTTLTMLCESITKETLGQSCNEEDAGEDIEDEEEEDDEEEEEEEEVERKRAQKKKKSNAGQNVEWKEEYGKRVTMVYVDKKSIFIGPLRQSG